MSTDCDHCERYDKTMKGVQVQGGSVNLKTKILFAIVIISIIYNFGMYHMFQDKLTKATERVNQPVAIVPTATASLTKTSVVPSVVVRKKNLDELDSDRGELRENISGGPDPKGGSSRLGLVGKLLKEASNFLVQRDKGSRENANEFDDGGEISLDDSDNNDQVALQGPDHHQRPGSKLSDGAAGVIGSPAMPGAMGVSAEGLQHKTADNGAQYIDLVKEPVKEYKPLPAGSQGLINPQAVDTTTVKPKEPEMPELNAIEFVEHGAVVRQMPLKGMTLPPVRPRQSTLSFALFQSQTTRLPGPPAVAFQNNAPLVSNDKDINNLPAKPSVVPTHSASNIKSSMEGSYQGLPSSNGQPQTAVDGQTKFVVSNDIPPLAGVAMSPTQRHGGVMPNVPPPAQGSNPVANNMPGALQPEQYVPGGSSNTKEFQLVNTDHNNAVQLPGNALQPHDFTNAIHEKAMQLPLDNNVQQQSQSPPAERQSPLDNTLQENGQATNNGRLLVLKKRSINEGREDGSRVNVHETNFIPTINLMGNKVDPHKQVLQLMAGAELAEDPVTPNPVLGVSSTVFHSKGALEELNYKENKIILLYTSFFGDASWEIEAGAAAFKRLGCKVTNCAVTYQRLLGQHADALLFHNRDWRGDIPNIRHAHQRYVFFSLETPIADQISNETNPYLFNWTMSYRKDSDIYAHYGSVISKPIAPPPVDYMGRLKTKSRPVAWMVSNCFVSSQRRKYVDELMVHIEVDVYGDCGPFKCYRDLLGGDRKCMNIINNTYWFYLSFESALCEDYITEKFYMALALDVVPIVRGAGDYNSVTPGKWFLNTDDYPSPKALADKLHYLMNNPGEYIKYLQDREKYEIKPFYGLKHIPAWCELCAKLNSNEPPTTRNVKEWWDMQHCRWPSDLQSWFGGLTSKAAKRNGLQGQVTQYPFTTAINRIKIDTLSINNKPNTSNG